MRVSSTEAARAFAPPSPDGVQVPHATPSAPGGPDVSFSDLMSGLGRELDSGESTVRGAMASIGRGRDLAPSELISLQARVYRYSEVVDLTSRAIDRGTSGVKAVLQGGGQ